MRIHNFHQLFSRRHRKSRRISENESSTKVSESEVTSHANEQKILDENQSPDNVRSLDKKNNENGSDEFSNATKESKSALDDRQEEMHLIENKSVLQFFSIY